MSEDDDWFERALRERGDGETDGDEEDTESEAATDSTADVGSDDSGADSGSDGSEADTNDSDADVPDTSQRDAPDSDTFSDQPPAAFPAGSSDDASDRDNLADAPADTAADAPADSPDDVEDDPFSMDFATAFENAPMPEVDDTEGGFGGQSSGGMGDDFMFDAGDRPDSQSFDDEEFESQIDRIDIGIEGLDDMILGGVPKRSLMVAIGSAGTGKTTFGLQFLWKTLREGGSGVYITLEESRERILNTADEKGWDFSEHEADDRLAIVDLDPVEMANSLSSIRNDLPRLIEDFGADRLVLDSVSLLEMMYDRPSKRRSEVFNFTRSLKDAGVTTMLTSEADQTNPYVSRHGIVEYLSDAVFVLQYVRPDDFRETRLAIEIQKIRDANHSRETKPYELTSDGISVYRQANIF
ncbi:KaiC domain-containing protein [Haloferax mediterranei ATCC 33500]|uniref:Circadian clock protein KaiC n=1 Tax=Haloferax mediterranei (strain ATCC 33500 / DSM 1411 / JCM 8866 / NBRC 14739 / NCIMB 2177 / R-4) TaxID=523841 RepID=I3R747_HALMT|nr:KaiC domain-containing protein [Haloferax mediterranei]AFK20057.1 RecA-superfamily ATPase possibly involved in signal transduction [Haloferax mediterranei ATCC 33500]AHZ23434.1 circadian clock protein KaiC [Haloferax mediterranei ATCC 33500]ELZ99605.1 recombinase A [Haloferax mediterranei ATCC 33500]MDX5987191.1 KaiC domain-containing protein [Haloferax mediterranei ATCC 33500]QCQ76497.1 KaiC domain-containing protein [Haloferax mediterranei ATCC 33500]